MSQFTAFELCNEIQLDARSSWAAFKVVFLKEKFFWENFEVACGKRFLLFISKVAYEW